MATPAVIPPPPEGFDLDEAVKAPPPPDGFVLDGKPYSKDQSGAALDRLAGGRPAQQRGIPLPPDPLQIDPWAGVSESIARLAKTDPAAAVAQVPHPDVAEAVNKKGAIDLVDYIKALPALMKESAMTPLPQQASQILGTEKPPTFTELWGNAWSGLADAALGAGAGARMTRDFPAVVEISHGLTGIADFMTTPLGLGTAGTGGLPGWAKAAVGAGYGAGMASDTKQAIQEARAKPDASTVSRAAVQTFLNLLPIAHAAPWYAREAKGVAGKAFGEAHNVEAARLVEQDRLQGTRKDLGTRVVGEAIPIQFEGKDARIEFLGQGKEGRPAYRVVGENGKTVQAGYGQSLQEFLRIRDARSETGARPEQKWSPEPDVRIDGRDFFLTRAGGKIYQLRDAQTGKATLTAKFNRMADFLTEQDARIIRNFEPPEAETAAKPAPTRANRAERRAAVTPAGAPEDVYRVADARDNLAQYYFGTPFKTLNNPDRLAIDDLVIGGHGFSAPPKPEAPKEAAAQPVTEPEETLPTPVSAPEGQTEPPAAAVGKVSAPPAGFELDEEPETTPAPEEKPRTWTTEPTLGKTVEMVIPGTDRKVRVQYTLGEAEDRRPSHDPVSFAPNPLHRGNERQYGKEDQARVIKFSSDESHDPLQSINLDVTPQTGPSIEDKTTGELWGGNNRGMVALRVMARPGSPAHQRNLERLTATLPDMGIPAEAAGKYAKPMVSRVLLDPVKDWSGMVADLNRKTTTELKPEERAVADGKRLHPKTIAALAGNMQDVGDDASLADALRGDNGVDIFNRLVKDGLFTEEERGAYLERDALTPEAKARIVRAMVGRLFNNPQDLMAAPPALRKKLERSAVHVMRVEERPDWSITEPVREALALLETARAHKITVLADLQKQTGGPQFSAQAYAIAQTLQRGDLAAAQAFRRYANDEALSREGAQSSFFEPPSQAEAFRDAFQTQMLAGRAKTAPPAAQETIAQADWKFSSRRNTVFGNPQMSEVMSQAVGHPGLEGLQLEVADVELARAAVSKAISSGKYTGAAKVNLWQIRGLLDQHPRGFIYVEAGPNLTTPLRQLYREEIIHSGQRSVWLTGGEAVRLMQHPTVKKMAPKLHEEGYDPKDRNGFVAEATAKILSGQRELYGVSLDEALDLIEFYARILDTRFGPGARFRIEGVAPGLRRPFYGEKEEATAAGGGAAAEGVETRAGPVDEPAAGRPAEGRPGLYARRAAAHRAGDWKPEDNLDLFGQAEQQAAAETKKRYEEDIRTDEQKARDSLKLEMKGAQETAWQPSLLTDIEEQGRLFGRKKKVLTLGVGQTLSDDIIPAVKDAATTFVESGDDILKVWMPSLRGQSAQKAAMVMRMRLAELARRYDQAEFAMRQARKFFRYRDPKENYEFIRKMEDGEAQGDANLDQIATILRTLLDGRRQDVQSLGTGKLQGFYENYFPHVWERRKEAREVFASFFGRRPLEGSKSFLKQRKYPTFADGLQAGLKPISDNPVDLVMLKIREMDRYFMAHQVLDDWKEQGLAKFVDARKGQAPTGWKKIDDPIGTVYGPSVQQIPEYPNEGIYTALEAIADELGIPHKRGFKIGGPALGYAHHPPAAKILTRHGTDESTLGHEIGHQLEWRYNLSDRFLNYPGGSTAGELKRIRRALVSPDPATRKQAREDKARFQDIIATRKKINDEIRALADSRGGRKEYVRNRDEKMAAIVQAWTASKEMFQKIAPTTYGIWTEFLSAHPELKALQTMEGTMTHSAIAQPYDVGGLVIKGNWYAPEGAARILNNHLMPGLRSKSGIYRGLLGVNNVLNQFQLGFSAFHLSMTSIDAATSKLALAIHQAVHGQLAAAGKSVIQTPIAPVENILRGDKVLKEWYKPGSQSGEIGAIVKALVEAGGRARMDAHYVTHISGSMIEALRRGNVFGAAFRLPFAIVEQVARPIMEYIVPRQKLGVFADLARSEMARMGPNAPLPDVQRALQKAWDVVDDRMGQVVYDNYFWNRYAKDASMLLVRSVGWNLGSLRVIFGGALDFVKEPVKLAAGGKLGKPEFTYRMGYLIAFPIITAAIGAIVQYLLTGKGPESLEDYFFPQSGDLDEQGRSRRLNLPTYAKDAFHLMKEPIKTLTNKASPLISLASEMLQNKDFYGAKIRNVDDPIVQQLLDAATHVGEAFAPFGAREYAKASDLGTREATRFLPFVGLVPAPAVLRRSPAEEIAFEARQRMLSGQEARPQSAVDRSRILAHLRYDLKLGKPVREEVREAAAEGEINRTQIKRAVRESRMSSLQRSFNGLPLEDAIKVYQAATPEERTQIDGMMNRKLKALKLRPRAERERLIPKIREAYGLTASP